jgi:hypothetical protein
MQAMPPTLSAIAYCSPRSAMCSVCPSCLTPFSSTVHRSRYCADSSKVIYTAASSLTHEEETKIITSDHILKRTLKEQGYNQILSQRVRWPCGSLLCCAEGSSGSSSRASLAAGNKCINPANGNAQSQFGEDQSGPHSRQYGTCVSRAISLVAYA